VVEQGSQPGHGSNVNKCPYSSPDLPTVSGTADITVTIDTVGAPAPHLGQTITLSGTKLTLTFPGSFLDTAVQAGITSLPPTPGKLVISSTNASPATQTLSFTAPGGAIPLDGAGHAKDVTVSVNLKNTTWHPSNSTDDVGFFEKSVDLTTALDVPGLGTINVDINCKPNGSMQFLAIGAQGPPQPTTTVAPESTQGGTTTTTVAAAGSTTGTLPRTGANVLFLLVIGAILIDAGYALSGVARRRGHNFE
jgi:hypothetical protein